MVADNRSLIAVRGTQSARGLLGALQRVGTRIRARADSAVDALLGAEAVDRIENLVHRSGAAGVDPFGFDPHVAKYAVLVARAISRSWFRTECFGLENVPVGRTLLISNHSGQLPLDGLAIGIAMLLDSDPPRFVRSMVEKWTATLPFVSTLFPRCGQIVGVPENCERLLEMDETVLVFPEGARGISKTFDQRYKLAEFGLGFMRLALQTNTPVVPVAVVGAEEQYVSVANLTRVAKLFGAPALPVLPQLLIPGGFLPLPTKYRVYFGEPMTFSGDADDDDAVIEEKVWVVKATIQSMLNRGIKDRKHIFY